MPNRYTPNCSYFARNSQARPCYTFLIDQVLSALRFDFLPATEFMTAKEVAYAIKLQFDTIRIYRQRGSHFPAVKIKGRYYYRTADILAYIAALPLKKQLDLLTFHNREEARHYRIAA